MSTLIFLMITRWLYLISYSTHLIQCFKSILQFKHLKHNSLHAPTLNFLSLRKWHQNSQSSSGIKSRHYACYISLISSHLTWNPSSNSIVTIFEYTQNSVAFYHLHCNCFNSYNHLLPGFCSNSNRLLTSLSAFQHHLPRGLAYTLKICPVTSHQT